ncbi:hypothetical protein PAN31117_04213 [Pandoraea anapnoica]|uniref:Uncharacterized protein n=1 Tax=Pandoraea anapnoica TaxID=2508301 RepID=A0A5E5AFC8_9BURK|nr:hypothetical protein PAN31117_04213 [Pandoraea anapnoica]
MGIRSFKRENTQTRPAAKVAAGCANRIGKYRRLTGAPRSLQAPAGSGGR